MAHIRRNTASLETLAPQARAIVKPPRRPRMPRSAEGLVHAARPDTFDLRDRAFMPSIAVAPATSWFPKLALPIKHQGTTNACTGFALSTVVEHLLKKYGRERSPRISPFMLYSMARRYDEFPGSVEDEGSSLRGALKGWFKHGVCAEPLWPATPEMPPAPSDPEQDWWLDAVTRPLGSYYRVAVDSISDMHSALNEVGIVYASTSCHTGWGAGFQAPRAAARPTSFRDMWIIPAPDARSYAPGHAFAIVGYNDVGFLVHNSWGTAWGTHGYALLRYEDWLANAMDCWVAQLGVVTHEHREVSRATTLRTREDGRVLLSSSEVLRDRELSPFVVNVGNNGELSNAGVFRTQPDDIRALVDVHLAAARERWGLQEQPIDVCIYAHGGIVSEGEAAAVAARWVPQLYEQRIFPIFLMWETDFWTTLLNRLEDAVKGVPRHSGGLMDSAKRWWNERLERLLSRPGTLMWDEVKQNAVAISSEERSGAVLLYQHFKQSVQNGGVRMHLVGHSAGSVVHSHLVDRLVREGLQFESVSFLAPGVRLQDFDQLVRPRLEDGQVRRYQQFHLHDRAEQEDDTCGPYRRSILYLVSESFEGGRTTPLLGMQKYAEPYLAGLPNVTVHVAPGPVSAAIHHGAFDTDPATLKAVIDFIRQPVAA
ncbi:C1 family peptidase [Caldimonas brevitalea]|uniref:Cysteine protease n=1 Tax=Caldimonas brevitalea TaxID=413882 RepID=A0A0G3BU06_9BURK|nr:C1 family peptidase [Caldimonas brevitalea]AKJ30020.1 cysteine protease [Caldimonas brevitalea]